MPCTMMQYRSNARPFNALLLDGSHTQWHHINECAILLIFHGISPTSMCVVLVGLVDVASGDAKEATTKVNSVRLT